MSQRPAAEEAGVAVLLVGVHAGADEALEALARRALALVERGVDLGVEALEGLGDVGLGAVVDPLDVGRDLRPLGLVLALRALLVADRLRERLPAGAVHLLQAGRLEARRVALGLAEHALLGLAVVRGSCGGVLLGLVASGQRGLELRLVGLLDLLVGDVGLGHLGVDLGRPGGEIGVRTRHGRRHGRGATDRRRRCADRLGRHRRDRLGLGLGRVRRGHGRVLDVLLRALLALLDEPAHLALDLARAAFLEVVGLLEVLGRRGLDRLPDGRDERRTVERARLLARPSPRPARPRPDWRRRWPAAPQPPAPRPRRPSAEREPSRPRRPPWPGPSWP